MYLKKLSIYAMITATGFLHAETLHDVVMTNRTDISRLNQATLIFVDKISKLEKNEQLLIDMGNLQSKKISELKQRIRILESNKPSLDTIDINSNKKDLVFGKFFQETSNMLNKIDKETNRNNRIIKVSLKSKKEDLQVEKVSQEEERILANQKMRQEEKRMEQEKKDKRQAEKIRQETLLAQKLLKEKQEKERIVRERIQQEKAEEERLIKEEKDRIAEEERLEAEATLNEEIALAKEKARLKEIEIRLEKEKIENERIESERLAKIKAEKERIEAERLAKIKAEKERLEALRVAEEKYLIEKKRIAEHKAKVEKERLRRLAEAKARLEANKLKIAEEKRKFAKRRLEIQKEQKAFEYKMKMMEEEQNKKMAEENRLYEENRSKIESESIQFDKAREVEENKRLLELKKEKEKYMLVKDTDTVEKKEEVKNDKSFKFQNVYVIDMGIIKNVSEKAYILSRIKNQVLKNNIKFIKVGNIYSVSTNDYTDYNKAKKDLVEYKKRFNRSTIKNIKRRVK